MPGSSPAKTGLRRPGGRPRRLVLAARNFYRVLGIPRSESAEGVRAAFRALAKRFHPDRAGTGSAERFREIHEAYAVLSDPRQRGAYDSRLSSEERPARGGYERRAPYPQPAAAARRAVEPLIPQADPLSPAAPHAIPGTGRRQVLRAEVLMTQSEARQGGVATLTVPRARPCPACAGGGGFGPLVCDLCSASGVVRGEHKISIKLPPMASPRATYDVVIDELLGLVLHLDVRVATR